MEMTIISFQSFFFFANENNKGGNSLNKWRGLPKIGGVLV